MRVKLDIPLFDPKKKPLTKQAFSTADLLGLLQKHASENPQASVAEVVDKAFTESNEAREPETLGGALYRAITESEKAIKGSASEKRIRAKIANALCSDEHPEYADLKQDELHLLQEDVGAFFITTWLSAVDKALEEALKLSPEQVAAAVAVVPDAKDGAA